MAPQVIFKHVTYSYSSGRSSLGNALSDVSFRIRPGSFTMIIGRTGSGKSTLVQQMNGLLTPTKGFVSVGDLLVNHKLTNADVKKLRQRVGLVFQVAQDQLFGETVKDDLAFGPRNFGFSREQTKTAVLSSAKDLNLLKLLNASPFDLSGGQMKRVAIAGVLACHPQILILDEPTVGLDSYGEQHLMTLVDRLRTKLHLTVIMVTHQMNLVAKYATQVLVLRHGRLIADVDSRHLFSNSDLLRKAGLVRPFAPRFAMKLKGRGLKLSRLPLSINDLARLITERLKEGRYHE